MHKTVKDVHKYTEFFQIFLDFPKIGHRSISRLNAPRSHSRKSMGKYIQNFLIEARRIRLTAPAVSSPEFLFRFVIFAFTSMEVQRAFSGDSCMEYA